MKITMSVLLDSGSIIACFSIKHIGLFAYEFHCVRLCAYVCLMISLTGLSVCDSMCCFGSIGELIVYILS